MAVRKSLRTSVDALVSNPILVVPVVLLGLFQIPQLALQTINPLIGAMVSLLLSGLLLFVTPFFQAGIIGMADEAVDGRTSLSRFVDAGKQNYVSVLAAYLLLMVVNFVIGIVVVITFFVGGIAFIAGQSGGLGGGGTVLLVVVGGVALLALLAYLLVVFFVQFYGQAIVIDGDGAIDGLKRSYRVVRNHLLTVFAYSVIAGVIGGALGLAYGLVSNLASPMSTTSGVLPTLSLPVVLALYREIRDIGTPNGGTPA